MKTASDTLKAHLRSTRQFTICDLYTISVPTATWSTGLSVSYTTYHYSGSAYSVTYGGETYTGKDAIIERTQTRLTIGTEVDTLDLTVYADLSMLIGGIPFMQAVTLGMLDGATVRLDKAFIDTTDMSVIGTVNMFSGRVSKTEATRTSAKLSVNSDLELLNVTFPRNCYQPGCLNALYDGACGLSRNGFSSVGTVTSATKSSITISGTAAGYADGYWALGVILFTSGSLAGQGRTVKTHSSGSVTVPFPLSTVPAVGDTVRLYAGCDKSLTTCSSKFSNAANFRGMPYVPVPETSL